MLKKVVSLFVMFFALLSSQTFAHTSLIDSTPKDGEVVQESLKEVSLYFGTKVEESSTMTISIDGQVISFEKLSIDDDKMTATFLQPLSNGEYEVKYNIIGADGHPMEGQISFTVNVPEIEQAPEVVEDSSEQNTIVEESEQGIAEETMKSKEWPSYVIPTIIGILAVIVIGSTVMMMRRKK